MIDAKTYLIEILEYYIQRLKADKCTMSEIQSVTRTIEENMDIKGTISDFASFYGVPEVTVRTTINKKLFAKPQRKVLYPFQRLLEIVPDKWHAKK